MDAHTFNHTGRTRRTDQHGGCRDYDLAELEEIMFDGVAHVECPVCGDERTVEPDARDYECFTDGCEGKLNSPLVLLGMI